MSLEGTNYIIYFYYGISIVAIYINLIKKGAINLPIFSKLGLAPAVFFCS